MLVVVVVVVVVVVAGGDAWACAGTTTDWITGFVHLLGSASVATAPPMVTILITRLRSISFDISIIPATNRARLPGRPDKAIPSSKYDRRRALNQAMRVLIP